MNEDIVVPVAFFLTTCVLAIGIPLVRALVRRWDRESQLPKVPPEVAARLERMEQSIDAMAIEMERISEGQRFVTKLLADRSQQGALPGAARDRSQG